MSSWPTRRLGDLVEILSGFAFEADRFGDSGALPVVRIRDVVVGYSSTFYRGQYDEKFLVCNGDVLIGMDGEFNRGRWNGGDALLNQRVCRIRSSNGELDDAYLFHFLPGALQEIERITPFVTVKHLSVKQLQNLLIPLPSLQVQRRIAEVLDRADTLRVKRRTALTQIEQLVLATFFDMFGSPATNPKGWPVQPVSDYVTRFQGGRSFESESGEDSVTRNRVLKVSAVTGMEFLPTESKPVSDNYEPPREHFVRPGDLLFSRANTTELVGAVAYVADTPPNLLLPDKIWRFVWRQPQLTDPLFVWALFQTGPLRHEISRRATGTSGSMKNISQQKVLGMETIVPPLSLQQEFGKRLATIERLKSSHRASLAELDVLFDSLQYRAFRGEL
jgi:type I restriction enzyme S subunit